MYSIPVIFLVIRLFRVFFFILLVQHTVRKNDLFKFCLILSVNFNHHLTQNDKILFGRKDSIELAESNRDDTKIFVKLIS